MPTEQVETQPDGSIRSVEFEQIPAADGLTLEGYAAVFDSPARISNLREGDFTETIKPGAFARAVRANPKPVMQFDHGTHPMLGSIPVGVIKSMREDPKGLFISSRVHNNWLTEPLRDAIKEGSITGMSWRFTVPAGGDEWSIDRDSRTVTDIDILELGPVVFPAYTETSVSIRSQQFAEAVTDPDLLHDFSIGLLLANRDEPSDTADNPTPDDDTDARDDNEDVESFVVESPAPADSEGVRVANPAKHAVALMAVRTDLATQRSHLATHELSNR